VTGRQKDDVGSYSMTIRKGGILSLKEDTLYIAAVWRARFGRGFGPVVRQTAR
jgi:hypothetical protein